MQEHLWVTNANKAFETMKLSLQYHAQEGKELQVVHFRQKKNRCQHQNAKSYHAVYNISRK